MSLKHKALLTGFLSAIALLLTASCSGNSEDFHFHNFKAGEKRQAVFEIDMSDTACVYSIGLVCRFIRNFSADSTAFIIRMTSPSGYTASERVAFPSDINTVRNYIEESPSDGRLKAASTSGYYDLSWVYRTNIEPLENGTWTMSVTAAGAETAGNILGTGITITQTPVAGR